MANFAINIQSVSKKYLIGREQRANDSLRDAISYSIKSLARGQLQGQTQEFWALKDINLKIEHGDKVALIGHNGSGKSTLLKILSQITEPTTGQIDFYGKISALLEVGTGFHSELTGRENIFLNGSIMGMTRNDIKQQMDEIVEFSGIEDFLDTPVKRYSSGMNARLGFAVAAHLNSDILIVDEVLAVGDAAFQKKCLDKMDQISKTRGKTILFVSHNINAVKSICNKAALLDRGLLTLEGNVRDVYNRYAKDKIINTNYTYKTKSKSLTLETVETKVKLLTGQDWQIKLHLKANMPLRDLNIDFSLYSVDTPLICAVSGRRLVKDFNLNVGEAIITLTLKNLTLNNGDYYSGIFIADTKGNVLLDVLDIPAGSIYGAPSYSISESITSHQAQIHVEDNYHA